MPEELCDVKHLLHPSGLRDLGFFKDIPYLKSHDKSIERFKNAEIRIQSEDTKVSLTQPLKTEMDNLILSFFNNFGITFLFSLNQLIKSKSNNNSKAFYIENSAYFYQVFLMWGCRSGQTGDV